MQKGFQFEEEEPGAQKSEPRMREISDEQPTRFSRKNGRFPWGTIIIVAVVGIVVAIVFYNWGVGAEYNRVSVFLLSQCSQGVARACELLK
jgi:hypothetical protein